MISLLPNIITFLRICGSVSLIFIEPLTVAFFVIYTLAGISDVLDGFIARRFNVISEFGTKLDSIADFLFYGIMLLKIFPILTKTLPLGMWAAVIAIIAVRICSYTLAAVKYHRFAALHTYLNKLSGITIFFIPYFIKMPMGLTICNIVCVVAAIAAIEELIIHIWSKTYNSSTKTIIFYKKSNGAV